jgi:hypothetical protein
MEGLRRQFSSPEPLFFSASLQHPPLEILKGGVYGEKESQEEKEKIDSFRTWSG